MDKQKFEELLLTVRKPGRYIGGEWNAVRKEWTPQRVKFLLAFPDVYEVGMSNLGMKILYGILNKRDDCLCERIAASISAAKSAITVAPILPDTPLRLCAILAPEATSSFSKVFRILAAASA